MNAEQTIDTAKSLQRVQNYLERLEVAKGYHKECIHAFIDKNGDEIPLLVADLTVLLQQVTTTSTNTDTPVVPQGWKLVPVGWQFYEDGKWWNGDDRIKDHRKNTEEARYPIRDVYAVEQQVRAMLAEVSTPAPAAQEGWCDGCSPDNCCGCGPAAPAKVQPEPSIGEQP